MDTLKVTAPLLSARRCWIQGRRVYLEITERRSVSFPASKYAALAHATQADLEKISLDADGRHIRWESLDEVICVDDVANSRFVHTAKSAAP